MSLGILISDTMGTADNNMALHSILLVVFQPAHKWGKGLVTSLAFLGCTESAVIA